MTVAVEEDQGTSTGMNNRRLVCWQICLRFWASLAPLSKNLELFVMGLELSKGEYRVFIYPPPSKR